MMAEDVGSVGVALFTAVLCLVVLVVCARFAKYLFPFIRRTGWRNQLRFFTFMAFVLGWANFLVGHGVCMALGGLARWGYVANGHYYLGHRGKYTEVSEAAYRFNYWYTFLSEVFAAIPFCMLGIFALLAARRKRLERKAGLQRPAQDPDTDPEE
jgi:hypothetical protein